MATVTIVQSVVRPGLRPQTQSTTWRAVPTATLFAQTAAGMAYVEYGPQTATADSTGVVRLPLPTQDVCRPTTVQWIVESADGAAWRGPITSDMPAAVSIDDLTQLWGWTQTALPGGLPATPDSGVQGPGSLRYPDAFAPYVLTGLTVTTGAALQATVAPGAAYVGDPMHPDRDPKHVLAAAVTVPVPPNLATAYVDWNPARGASGVSISLTPSPTPGSVRLRQLSSSGTIVTLGQDLRPTVLPVAVPIIVQAALLVGSSVPYQALPGATPTTPGAIQLDADLGGTPALPHVVSLNNVADGSLQTAGIRDGAVTAAKLAVANPTAAQLAGIVDANIAGAAAISASKLNVSSRFDNSAATLDLRANIVTAQQWNYPAAIATDTYGRVTAVTSSTQPATSAAGAGPLHLSLTAGALAGSVDAATASAIGVVQLTSDLGGTATAPRVVSLSHVTDASLAPAGLAVTTAAKQFLAGPTAASGAVSQRTIVGTDLPAATPSVLGASLIDSAPSAGSPSALTAQGWVAQNFPNGWILSGGTVTGIGNTLAAGVAIAATTGWIPTTSTSGYASTNSGTLTNLPANQDIIVYWNGTTYVRQVVGIGYPAPTVAGQVQLARVTTNATTVTRIWAIRARHRKPTKAPIINIDDLGADPTRANDSTAAFNEALDIAMFGDGINGIELTPGGQYVCLGQVAPVGHQLAGLPSLGIGRGLCLRGTPSGGHHASKLEGTVIDLRWDGGITSSTGLRTTGDYAIVGGFHLSYTFTPAVNSLSGVFSALSITSGTQAGNYAYINNATTTDLSTVPNPGALNLAGLPLPVAGKVRKFYLDVDKLGNAYATQQGRWTNTTVADPGTTAKSYPVAGTGSACGQSPTPNTVRTWAIWIDSTGAVVNVLDCRPRAGKLDLRPFGIIELDGLTFTNSYYGQWDGSTSYAVGNYVMWANDAFQATVTPATAKPTSVAGQAQWTHFTAANAPRDLVPFIHVTAATPRIHNCSFFGPNASTARVMPAIDAIWLGGPGTLTQLTGSGDGIDSGFDGVTNSAVFSGYGGIIRDNYFQNIRCGIRFHGSASQIVVAGNYFGNGCGGGELEAGINYDAMSPIEVCAANNAQADNIFETTGYVHTVRYAHGAVRNSAVGDTFTDAWAGACDVTQALGPGISVLKVASPTLQRQDVVAWLGKQVLAGQTNGAGTATPSLPEILTISTVPVTGAAVGAGVTVVSQIDLETITLGGAGVGALASGTAYLLGDGIPGQEICALTSTTVDASGAAAPANSYKPSIPFQLTHNAGETVTQGPWSLTLATPTTVARRNQDTVSRSIAAIYLLKNLVSDSSSNPTAAVSNQIATAIGSAQYGVIEENPPGANAISLSGGPAPNNNISQIPTPLIVAGSLTASTFIGAGAGLTGLAAANFGSVAANTVLIGQNGANGPPTNRLLINADLPADLAPASISATATQTAAVLNPTAPLVSTLNTVAIASNTTIGTRADLAVTAGTQPKIAMRFQAGFSATVGQIQLSMHKDATNPPRGNDVLAVQLWTDNAGVPGAQIATANILIAGVASGAAGTNTYQAYWPPALSGAVTNGSFYWLVADGTSMLAGSIVYLQYDAAGSGLVATWNGSTWTPLAGTGFYAVNAVYNTATLTATNNSNAAGMNLTSQSGDGVSATTVAGRAAIFTSTFGVGVVATSASNNGLNASSTYGSALSANQTGQISSLVNAALASLKRQVTVPAGTTFNANSPLLDVNDLNISAAAAGSGIGTSTGLLARFTKNGLIGLTVDPNFNLTWAAIPAAAAPTVALAAGGSLADGVSVQYMVTYANANGETPAGTTSATLTPTIVSGNQTVLLTAIPTGQGGTTSRKIYRSDGGGAFGLIGTLSDNSTLTFTDAGLARGAAPPTQNTTGGKVTLGATVLTPGSASSSALQITGTPITVASGVTIGAAGTLLLQTVVYLPTWTPATVAANTTVEQTVTVAGLTAADTVEINPPGSVAGIGIAGARVSAANTLAVTFANLSAGTLAPPAGVYRVKAVRS